MSSLLLGIRALVNGVIFLSKNVYKVYENKKKVYGKKCMS